MNKDSGESHQTLEREDQKTLRTRLNNWVLERLKTWSPKPKEAKARWDIAQAMIRDINKPTYDQEHVITSGEKSIERLISLGVSESSPLTIQNRDSLYPLEEFETKFRREEESQAWIAEEVAKSGNVISRAVVHDNGNTFLTINPMGERFTNANPAIVSNQNFPEATVTTFNLLVSTIPTNQPSQH